MHQSYPHLPHGLRGSIGINDTVPKLMTETSLLEVHIPDGALPEEKLRRKLKAARAVSGLTLEELGRLIGHHHNTPPASRQRVWKWEQDGEIPGYYLGAIAAACGVPFDFFRV
jgi:hypothetical protein